MFQFSTSFGFYLLQFYDAYDVTLDAAKRLADYLTEVKHSPSAELTNEMRNRANTIANEALQNDEGLLAFAIAAPAIKLAVVRFREAIGIPPDAVANHTFLSAYWRGLGEAWNHTEGAQFWSAPFRDCNAIRGRWLWPFNLNFVSNGIK